MRMTPPPAATAALLLLAGAAPAQDDARAVVERAVRAHGGQERLAKARADKVHVRGTLQVEGKDGPIAIPFTGEVLVQLPNQLKSVLEVNLDKKRTVVQILNGDEAYVTTNGQPQKVGPAALAEMREKLFLDRAVRLVPLLTEKTYELASLGESKVGERPAVGVRVTARGRKELRMYFDKETGLLVKTEHTLSDPEGKSVRQEEYYGDFRDLGGYRRPVRVAAYRDGKKVVDLEVIDVKYYDKIDDAEFAKP
jgi:hypothetical protein